MTLLEGDVGGPWEGIVLRPGSIADPSTYRIPCAPVDGDVATIATVRQLPEQCASCERQIATLERCVLPDGTERRGAEVTFRESAEGGIRCTGCAKEK